MLEKSDRLVEKYLRRAIEEKEVRTSFGYKL